MAVDEQSRHDLHQRLDQVLGPEDATRLIEHLPPVAWTDIATKQDIELLRNHDLALLKQDIESLRNHDLALLKQDILVVKQDLVALEERMTLRLTAAIAGVMAAIADVRTEIHRQKWRLFFAQAGLMITLVFATRVA